MHQYRNVHVFENINALLEKSSVGSNRRCSRTPYFDIINVPLCFCPGSDVNSMDSVDSGCTMGAGDSQSNHTAPAGSEIVIWEIEVPKASGHCLQNQC